MPYYNHNLQLVPSVDYSVRHSSRSRAAREIFFGICHLLIMLKLVGSFLSFILHLEYISKLAISDLVMAIFSFQGWMSQLPKTKNSFFHKRFKEELRPSEA